MARAESLMTTNVLVLFSASALATPLPSEIYRPAGAHTVETDRQGNGEFEYEAELSVRHTSIPVLAKEVIARVHNKGFRTVEFETKRDDADLKFKRGRQELDVSIESKDHGRTEYKTDLDPNR